MAKISVIVPVYKVEAYLDRCVNSILAQNFQDFELILVDDGSPDNCGLLCDNYAKKDPRIHVIHQKNGGLSAARNAGIDWVFAESESQWLAFVDSDDWIHPEYLRRLYTAVEETGCKISACGFFRTAGEAFPPLKNDPARELTADEYYCQDLAGHGVTAVAWNKLYSRDLFASIRYPVGKLHEDEFTTYKLVYAAGSVAAVEDKLLAYFQNAQGIMLSKWKPARLHALEAFRQQMDYARERKLEQLYRKAVNHTLYTIHEQLAAADPEFHRQLRKEYRQALKWGRQCGVFPMNWENLWAYEEAYPAKLFWWPLMKGNAVVRRIAGK